MKHPKHSDFPNDYHYDCDDCKPDDPLDSYNAAKGILNALRMMSHILLWLAVIYMLTGCSSIRPNDWSDADVWREGAYQVVNIADAIQTNGIQHRDDLIEGNPIARAVLGEEPKTRDVVMYFGTLAISHYLISIALPDSWRPWWQTGTLGAAGYTVIYNNCIQNKQC